MALLDTVGSLPTFAYSISRYLRTAYVGEPVCQLFEATGSTTKDFKLNGSNVLVTDDGSEDTVATWLAAQGASVADIHILYDHTGNANHATYPNVGTTTRPRLHQSSSLNGLAIAGFNAGTGGASTHRLYTPSITSLNTPGGDFYVLGRTGVPNASTCIVGSIATSVAYCGINASNQLFIQADLGVTAVQGTTAIADNTNFVGTFWISDTTVDDWAVRINGIQDAIDNETIRDWRTGVIGIGNIAGSATNVAFQGYIAEMIGKLTGPYSSTDRAIIEADMLSWGGLASTTDGAGAASGAGTAAGVGHSIFVGVGSATGVGAAASSGAATTTSVAVGAGVGVAAAVGSATTSSVGLATGSGSAAGIGGSVVSSSGSVAGIGTAVGISDDASTGSAAGTSTVSAAGASIFSGAGSSAGTGAASAGGSSHWTSAGTSSGASAAVGIGSSTAAAVGGSSGTGLASATGEDSSSFSPAIGNGIGSGVASGVGSFSRRRLTTRTKDGSSMKNNTRPSQVSKVRTNTSTRRRGWTA